ERNGTANLFMMFAPLEGWRRVKVTDRHTAVDYAHVLKDLADIHFPRARTIVLVQDNLNIHSKTSLYEAFPAAEARRLVERFEWHYTPKHGSWLDLAESELGVLSSQCLDRRIPDELALLFCDLALLTFVLLGPNPIGSGHWPAAMQLHLGNFIYFFVLLSGATLAYFWRPVIAVGTWTSALWIIGIAWVWWQPDRDPALTARIAAAIGSGHRLFQLISPNSIVFGERIQEIVVFMIVAVTLAVAVRRSNDLLIRHAAVERERGNLARYFSPNVVEELSGHDEPLKQVRTQNVAVLFVDIVGFTAFADARTPDEVVRTLREFHALMEQEVFRHSGTLDKYLGDGLMATFGTPFAGKDDASNALRCARAWLGGGR